MSEDISKTLADACDTFGKIMHALATRRILKKDKIPPRFVEKMQKDALSDEELERLAVDGFEAAAMKLAEIKYPGAMVISCNPDEFP